MGRIPQARLPVGTGPLSRGLLGIDPANEPETPGAPASGVLDHGASNNHLTSLAKIICFLKPSSSLTVQTSDGGPSRKASLFQRCSEWNLSAKWSAERERPPTPTRRNPLFVVRAPLSSSTKKWSPGRLARATRRRTCSHQEACCFDELSGPSTAVRSLHSRSREDGQNSDIPQLIAGG